MNPTEKPRSAPQLIRLPYFSKATGESRNNLVYLPAGYENDPHARWPVILFLHGAGERGDGKADLDYVLVHGPLGEAWIYKRDLPFVMIGPQLPLFGMENQVQWRADCPPPVRLEEGIPERKPSDRPARAMARSNDPFPEQLDLSDEWGDLGSPGGWQLCRDDVMMMLDTVLGGLRTDPQRVYLTGLSYGGYGAWDLATTYPERWAAVAPFCGDGNTSQVAGLAQRQVPVWIFHGGRDPIVKPRWAYEMANALESAGHRRVRLTVHEDLGHDCWTRAYSGKDLYDWFLQQRRA